MEVEKRRRSSSDASMKEKKGKKVRAEVEAVPAVTPMEEEGKRERRAPATYKPEAGPSRRHVKAKKRVAAVPGKTEGKTKMVATRHNLANLATEEMTLPPLKLSPRHFQEYREPVSIPSSASSRKSSSLKVLEKITNRTHRKDAALVNDVKKMIEKFEDLRVEEPEQIKIPKIPRHPEALLRYSKYRKYFQDNVQKKAKIVIDNEDNITAMSTLIEKVPLTTLDNIRNFQKGLKAIGIGAKQIRTLKDLPNPAAILEHYEIIRIKLVELYDAEIKIFKDIFQKYTVNRIKYFNKLNNEKLDDKQEEYRYYLTYYDEAMTKLSELLDTIIQEREEDIAKLDTFESTKAKLIPLQKTATEIIKAYEEAQATLTVAKAEQASNLDDLMALFGKL